MPASCRSSARFDEFEVEVELDDVAEHRPERAEPEVEVLAADLTARLERGVACAIEEVGDAVERDREGDRSRDVGDRQLAVDEPVGTVGADVVDR